MRNNFKSIRKIRVLALKICVSFSFFILPYTLCPVPFLNAEVKIIPVMDISLLGGKYFLDDDAASFEGKADFFASPVIEFSEHAKIVPVYSGYYNGTQDIQELAGGGVLTRERMAHTVSFKYVRDKNFNKFKPRVSYAKDMVKETKDEDWGDGLFDYDTFSAGVEFEQERPYGTFSQSYDFYSVKYPNYASLISQSDVSIDTTTFAELSTNSGTDTMDNINHMAAFSFTWFPDPYVMKTGYEFTYRKYSDQPIVGEPVTGSAYFKSDKRTDLINSIRFNVFRDIKPVSFSLNSHLTYLHSNQNSYDSSRTKYTDNYYGYIEMGLSPGFSLNFKKGGVFSLGLGYRKLYYLGRYAQDVSGNYKSSKTQQSFWLSNLFLRYPLMNRLFIRTSYAYQISSANMLYEADYRYNYRASSYLMGFEWEF